MTDPNPKNQQTPITSFTQAKWQTVTKKRKITQSPPSPAGVLTAENNATKTKPIITSNKYAVLAEPTTNIVSDNITSVEITNTTSSIKKILAPPIFVKGVNNHKAMIDNVLQIIPTEHLSTKSLTNNSVKINVTDIESYRKLTKEFRHRQVAFYTYQVKSERAFRVVIWGLHQSCTPDEIKEALCEVGYEVRNVANIRHHRTKEPLPLFFVDLEPYDSSKKIYELNTLLHQKVRVESPRPRIDIT
ncbi:hypothetical protein PGB90_003288 [Kerria lacca]